MRKLVVLLLVFAMASLANAAIVSFSAEDYVPGSPITITVSSDELVTGLVLALITDNGFAGTATPGAWDALFTVADPGYNADDFGLGGTGDLIMVTGAITPGFPATGDLYTYTYDVPTTATGDITFTVEDAHGYFSSISYMVGDVATPMSITGMEFTSVPEPMTIALLGLGGLFLLRRRK